MRTTDRPNDDDAWIDPLPTYEPVTPRVTEPPPKLRRRFWQRELPERVERVERVERRPSRAGSWLLALGLGAAVAVVAVFSLQDSRSVGTQLDDAVAGMRGLGNQAGRTLTDSRDAAAEASRSAVDGVSSAITDSATSAKIKAALAADPALSASRIEVTTTQGIVRLEGPAPDAAAKQRATVLASARRDVRGVDNRLTLPQPGQVVAVVDGLPRAAPAASAPAAATPLPQ